MAASRPGRIVAVLAGAVLVLLVAGWRGWPPPIVADDVGQPRLDTALPLLGPDDTLRQEFTPRRSGLSEIELLAARYEGAGGEGALWLGLRDDQGMLIGEQRLAAGQLRHNQPVTLRLPPQPASAGRRYTLELRAEGTVPFSVWGHSLAGAGGLEGAGASGARSLRFQSRYTLDGRGALAALLTALRAGGALYLIAGALLLGPGLLALSFVPASAAWGPGVRLGTAAPLGLALWPLMWQGSSLLGLRWNGALLGAVAAATWGGWLWRGRRGRRGAAGRFHPADGALLLLFLAALAVRLVAVRDLAFPPWVDPLRHALVTRIMVDTGQVPTDYLPFLPVERFPYHWGYHTLPAMLVLLTGRPIPGTLLWLGQGLNALVVPAVYAGTWLLARRRGTALAAAFLVAFPLLFPAYYATWGRYTQLAALPLAALVPGLLWRGRARGMWLLLGVLGAGLFLIHVRVTLYLLPLVPLVAGMRRGRTVGPMIAAGGLATLLVSPRLWTLMTQDQIVRVASRQIEGYNVLTLGFLDAGWERPLAGAAAGVALLAVLAARRPRPWARPALLLAGWLALLALPLGAGALGLPAIVAVNPNSLYILLFLPQAMLLALGGEGLWEALSPPAQRWPVVQGVRDGLLGAILTLLLLFGARQQGTIVNPATVLADAADAAALEWIAAESPPDARFVIGAWRWLGTTWAGSDGGAWIGALTGRGSSTPPPDYVYNAVLHDQVDRFNQRLAGVEAWAAAEAVRPLRAAGYTHIYVGPQGTLEPAALARNPALSPVYEQDGVWIFLIEPERRGSVIPP